MKKLVVVLLLLAGCAVHVKEFDAVEGWLDARLALRNAEAKSIEAGVLPLATPVPPEPPMPLPNALEGADAARRRAGIERKRALLQQLEAMLAESVAAETKRGQ